MPGAEKLEKAELRELDAAFTNEINTDKKCQVQFNPETLKVSFANQVATPSGAGDQKGTPARQFVGAGTTKLSLQLWFDVTAFQGCLVRMGDKFIRVSNLSKNPASDKVGEAITDTLQDLAVYCIIAMCLWEEEVSAILCDGGTWYDAGSREIYS